jgi:ribosomal protein S18 acetylase RimI-like enzyme
VQVRRVTAGDADWVQASMTETWGSVLVARKGELVDTSALPGFLAVVDERRVGVALVAVRDREYEVVSIAATSPGHGVGRALLQRCVEDARSLRCQRLWLTTTNDNVRALAFYQRFGLDLCGFSRNGVDGARRLKPTIPLRDEHGVPISHELELELLLG